MTPHVTMRNTLEQVQDSLNAAAKAINTDVDAATDDLLAAHLLVSTALALLDDAADENDAARA